MRILYFRQPRIIFFYHESHEWTRIFIGRTYSAFALLSQEERGRSLHVSRVAFSQIFYLTRRAQRARRTLAPLVFAIRMSMTSRILPTSRGSARRARGRANTRNYLNKFLSHADSADFAESTCFARAASGRTQQEKGAI